MLRTLAVAIISLVALVSTTSLPASAASVTLRFDELPRQPVDDLSFMGVTFDFKVGGVDSADASYNGAGPGSLTFVQDPSLEGDAAGVLTLDFARPTALLQAGVALDTTSALSPGFTVELFDMALTSLGVTSVNTSPLVNFTEAQFNYSGVAILRAVFDFNEGGAPRFAVDNLTFNVPEPAALLLLGAGLVGLGLGLRRRG